MLIRWVVQILSADYQVYDSVPGWDHDCCTYRGNCLHLIAPDSEEGSRISSGYYAAHNPFFKAATSTKLVLCPFPEKAEGNDNLPLMWQSFCRSIKFTSGLRNRNYTLSLWPCRTEFMSSELKAAQFYLSCREVFFKSTASNPLK